MDFSRVIGILAFIVQVLNASAFVLEAVAPKYVVLTAGIVAAIQAFTGRVQGVKGRI